MARSVMLVSCRRQAALSRTAVTAGAGASSGVGARAEVDERAGPPWPVLGSDQHRLSRRFYRALPIEITYSL